MYKQRSHCLVILLFIGGITASARSADTQQEQSTDQIESNPVRRITFRRLNLEKRFPKITPEDVKKIPESIRSLEGKYIAIQAPMYPTFKKSGIREFAIMEEGKPFGPGIHISTVMMVKMREGVTADYVGDKPITVVGKFKIRPKNDDCELYALYHLTEALVSPE